MIYCPVCAEQLERGNAKTGEFLARNPVLKTYPLTWETFSCWSCTSTFAVIAVELRAFDATHPDEPGAAW